MLGIEKEIRRGDKKEPSVSYVYSELENVLHIMLTH